MRVRWLFLFLLVGFLTSCSESSESVNHKGFSLVCDYFQELQTHKKLSELTRDQRNNFIVEKITKTLPDSIVWAAWDVASYVELKERYGVFRTSAEEVLGMSWTCDAMMDLAPTTGVFD